MIPVVNTLDLKMGVRDDVAGLGVPFQNRQVGQFFICRSDGEEMTPPEGYTKSPDQNKVKQSFHWDGKSDVSLVFENDSKVKIQLIKLDDSNRMLPSPVMVVESRKVTVTVLFPLLGRVTYCGAALSIS